MIIIYLINSLIKKIIRKIEIFFIFLNNFIKVFLLYFVWNLSIYLISLTHLKIEKLFLVKNNPFLIIKRGFRFISFFEKLFLVLFYKRGWFEKSIANLYRKKDIIDYRRSEYPIIHSFHTIHNEVKYNLYDFDLKFFIKIFSFYKNNSNLYFKKLKNFFYYESNIFIIFLVINKIFFKKYFNLNDYYYFYEFKQNNILKFNRIFLFFFLKSKKKFVFYDLNKWNDWYIYNFSTNFLRNHSLEYNKKLNYFNEKKYKVSKILRIIKYHLVSYEYRVRIKNFNKIFNSKKRDILYFKFNLNNFFNVKISRNFLKLMKYYKIKFSESSITKYLNTKNLKNYNFFYLRKNRIFNKGRYSRNRQLYRTGVYWCLWLNIIMVYGLYFIFYRFSFNFGYFWWGIMFLAYSTIFSRIIKYNFFNINYLLKEFYNLYIWYGFVIKSFYLFFNFYAIKYIIYNSTLNKIFIKNKKFINFFFEKYYYFFAKLYKIFIVNKINIKPTFIWQGMKERDYSRFRYKTIIHWIKEIFRLIITK